MGWGIGFAWDMDGEDASLLVRTGPPGRAEKTQILEGVKDQGHRPKNSLESSVGIQRGVGFLGLLLHS